MDSQELKTDPKVANRGKIVAGYVAVGVVATLILLGIKVGIENSSVGRDNELWVFGKLQSVLPDQDAENPIILIDISDLRGGTPGDATSRDGLFNIIQALVDLKGRPKAVGIDIDFSPKSNEYVSDNDYDFFQNCLKLSRDHQMPVFLAVGQRKGAPPEAWLGSEEFESLASAVAIDAEDTRRMPLWVRPKGSEQALNTMSYSLARVYRKTLPEAQSWIAPLLEPSGDDLDEKRPTGGVNGQSETLVYADRLVNYSKLDALKNAAKKDVTPEAVRNTGDVYKNRIVILGDVSKPRDSFPIPGRKKNESGTLILASATYTLIKEPLFEFRALARIALDILIAGVIIAMVAVIRYRNPNNHSWIGKQALFIYGAVVVVLGAGFLLVRLAGVMWLDFVLVISALALHPKVERAIHWILERRSNAKALTASTNALVAIFTAALILGSHSKVNAQQATEQCQTRVAAVAVEFQGKGSCYSRQRGTTDKKVISKSDLNKKQFYAGEQISCEKSCTLVILLCGNKERYSVLNKYPKWYRVLHANSSPVWIDSKTGVPARSSKNFVPEYPRTQSAPAVARDGARVEFGAVMGDRLGMIAGIASVISPASHPAPSPSPAGTPKVPSPEEEKELAKAREWAAKQSAFVELIEKGNRALADKKYSDAHQFYNAATEIKADDWRSIYGIGNTYFYQEKWDEAEMAYRKALVLSTNRREVLSALAFVLLQPRNGLVSEERLNEAESCVWRYFQQMPESESALELLEQSLEKRNASVSIREGAYRKALALGPRSIDINLRLSNLLRTSGRDTEADSFLAQAEKQVYFSTQAVPIAEVLMSLHRYEEAKLLLERTQIPYFTDVKSLLMLARIYVIMENYKDAVRVLTEASQFGSNSDLFLMGYLRGVAELHLKHLTIAEGFLDTAATATAGREDNSLALAYQYASIGDSYAVSRRTTNAIRLYEKAIRLDPEDKATETRLIQLRQQE